MLDHLLRLLGYVPAASSRLVGEAPAAAETAPRAHRVAAASFDFRAAVCDELCFSYDDGDDVFSYAVGRDGWAPLAIAGLALVPGDRCAEILEAAVVARVWADGPTVRSWAAANVVPFEVMRERADPASALLGQSVNVDDFGCDVIPRLSAVEMGAEFVRVWQRARADWPVFFLANSPAQIALARHHTNLAATDAASYALERCAIWLAVWFETRGIEVDRERTLVKIEGYEALFYSASQGI
ncbi:hypothetical protein PQR34_32075 [Paraburkholderia sediminicola]|uniref:hypothetical protein n=1 Tax=Paraburkholderia sediminicola TaxID=458836 RepID=UPI0038BA3764